MSSLLQVYIRSPSTCITSETAEEISTKFRIPSLHVETLMGKSNLGAM